MYLHMKPTAAHEMFHIQGNKNPDGKNHYVNQTTINKECLVIDIRVANGLVGQDRTNQTSRRR